MFWDQVAGIYDIFVNIINRKTHKKLKKIVSDLIEPDDVVLEFLRKHAEESRKELCCLS